MSEWRSADSAPRDGTEISVKRVHEGRIIYEGKAFWGSFRVNALIDPITDEIFADAIRDRLLL